jgi:hypothetical protein
MGLRRNTAGGHVVKSRNLLAILLLIVGLTQMAGDLLGSRALKGFGAVTVIAPCPRVFGDMDGFEPFAASFTIVAEGDEIISVPVTPEFYSRFKGPYNRRNVYGAAIAAAPRLPEPIWRSVFSYAFAPNGPLRNELAIPTGVETIVILIRSNTRGRNDSWAFRSTL